MPEVQHVHYFSRYIKIAGSIPVPEEYQDLYGPDLITAIRKFGGGMNRKIAGFFADFSNDEMTLACRALATFAIQPHPDRIGTRVFFRAATGYEIIHQARIIALLVPAFKLLFSADTSVEATFARLTIMDGARTPKRHLLMRVIDDRRTDLLHGFLMVLAAPEGAINNDDAEWFGRNRKRILPAWEEIRTLGSYDLESVAALLESHGNSTLLAR